MSPFLPFFGPQGRGVGIARLSAGARFAILAVLLYAGALSLRTLNANDLFWHLATGREILRTGAVPRTDPFSFAGDGKEWIDHEWLWQIAAQSLYSAVAQGRGPTPDPAALAALDLFGAALVLGAFYLGMRRMAREGVPAGALVVLGLIAAEAAKERLMVRPETASLLFLAIVLSVLRSGTPGLRRGLWLAATTALWANVHPAALLAPGLVLLWGLGELAGGARSADGAPSMGAAPFRGAGLSERPPEVAAPDPLGRVLQAQDRGDPQSQIAAAMSGKESSGHLPVAAPAPPGIEAPSGGDLSAEGAAPPRGTAPSGARSGSTLSLRGGHVPVEGRAVVARRYLLEVVLVAAATLVNPYGARIWTVPFKLARLVKTSSIVNPEWLEPPVGRFPFFYVAVAIVGAGTLVALARWRRLPGGAGLVALFLAALGRQQMRHMGLFAVAFLFAGGSLLRALDVKGILARLLGRRAVAAAAAAGALIAAVPVALQNASEARVEGGLDPGRFPVAAAEQIERQAPGLRVYNDVQFGGYLIWRLFPGRPVFIDGRNEVYEGLLSRLARIHTGEASYSDWRGLVRELGIEGAVVKYREERKGVIYPPVRPGEPPTLGYRAWSAFLFPVSEWALVYFDDTALVFMRRRGGGEAWIRSGEYREYNPEDRIYLLERARHDPALAERLRAEAARRLREAPPSRRAERFLQDLEALTIRVNDRSRSVSPAVALGSEGSAPNPPN